MTIQFVLQNYNKMMKIILVVTNCAKIMLVQSIKTYCKMPVIPRCIIPEIPHPISHIYITLVRVKTGDKMSLLFAYNNFLNLIILAAIVHNYMILSETSIEEFPRRRRQIITKKYPRELYSPFADHPGV